AFPDALSAAGIAGRMGAPLIIVPGNAANLSGYPTIVTELSRLAPTHVYIAGSTASVSAGIAAQIGTLLGVTPVRFAGANRYETATKMTDYFFGTVSGTPVAPFTSPPGTVYIASGLNFPDALAGAALAGWKGGPLLLVPGTSATVDGIVVAGHAIIREELLGLQPHQITVFGSSGAVSNGIFIELEGIPRS
ncbi:MAG: cell wall-binding repeat-containing protein, partial [Candidatus Limnocylindrales bacterium]